MKRFFEFLSLVIMLMSFSTMSAKKLKLMTYNLHHCEGVDKQLNEGRIADIILKNSPEVIALQELDSVTSRCPSYQMEVLGKKTGMFYTFARSINYGGGKYGIGMLSKEKPLNVKRIPLPGKEPRVMLICEFKDYIYADMHLCLHSSNRIKSLPIILEQAGKANKPFLIAGDWNATPSDEFIEEMSKHFDFISDKKTFTFSSYNPKECIDYIAVYKSSISSLKVKSFEVLSEPVASDHNPLKASIVFK